jgi:hypothetical protein
MSRIVLQLVSRSEKRAIRYLAEVKKPFIIVTSIDPILRLQPRHLPCQPETPTRTRHMPWR